MKIEIDLKELFQEEDESFEDAIRREVISSLTSQYRSEFSGNLMQAVKLSIESEVKTFLMSELPKLMDLEFQEVNSWGRSEHGKKSVKNRILEALEKNTCYKETGWSSNDNAFTQVIKKYCDDVTREFRGELKTHINYAFKKECIAEATKVLKEEFGLK